MRVIRNKKADLMQKYLIQIILSAMLVLLFLMAIAEKSDSRGVKQQVLEKQLALLVESASPGMSFSVDRVNLHGRVNDLRVNDGRIFVDVNGLLSIGGYPYFSRYVVSVKKSSDKFVVVVG